MSELSRFSVIDITHFDGVIKITVSGNVSPDIKSQVPCANKLSPRSPPLSRFLPVLSLGLPPPNRPHLILPDLLRPPTPRAPKPNRQALSSSTAATS